ncbi:MAG: Gfo/Idh/MocA family oxidoreductase [Thermoleophilia bacterium]
MRDRLKHVAVAGLDRILTAQGLADAELELARSDAVQLARVRVASFKRRRPVVKAVRVVVTRPGRAELRPTEVALAGPGEVTVELLASAISAGTERAQWLRLPHAQPKLPFVPGYSGAGRVLATGADVAGLEPGMLVAVARARHASAVTVPAAWATPVPEGVRVQDAALVYLAIIAGYGVRRAGPLDGQPLCVVGAGPIGALAQRLAQLQGAGPVTVVATSRRREAAALRGGADRFLTADERTRDIEAAAVIEATGDPDALALAAAAARRNGVVVLLGSPRGITRDASLAEIQSRRLRLVGAHVSALATEARQAPGDPFAQLAEAFLDAVAAGRLDPSDLAGDPFDPREIGLLYRGLARGDVAAAHLDWTCLPRAERVRRQRPLALPQLRPAAAAPIAPPPMPAAPVTSGALRFSLIGCGDIGLLNARAVAAAANAELTLCHDASPALAAAAAARHGGEVAATLEQALDPARVDVAFISVPHDLHAPLVERAAEAGLHVVVEKPLGVDLAAAERAIAATAAAGVTLSVCHAYRYEATVRTARRLVAAGAVGALGGVAVVFHADKPASYWHGGFSGRAASGWRQSRERAGGGVLIMNLLHYLDLTAHVTGLQPAWVAGVARTPRGAEVEDGVALSVGFDGGAVGSFAASATTRGRPANRFELWGDVGTLRLSPDAAVYTERALDGIPTGRWAPLDVGAGVDLRRVFVERFVDALLSGRTPDVTAADGLAVQVFVDAAYRSIEAGRPVHLGAREPAPA